MKAEEQKQLLLKDLCARLPYGVKLIDSVGRITELTPGHVVFDNLFYQDTDLTLDYLPLLRPMESMTEEEEIWYSNKVSTIKESVIRFQKHVNELQEWLNKNHFDYRGLIPMGLALPAKEGMYN